MSNFKFQISRQLQTYELHQLQLSNFQAAAKLETKKFLKNKFLMQLELEKFFILFYN